MYASGSPAREACEAEHAVLVLRVGCMVCWNRCVGIRFGRILGWFGHAFRVEAPEIEGKGIGVNSDRLVGLPESRYSRRF